MSQFFVRTNKSLNLGNTNVGIIWESTLIDKSKATYIFKWSKNNYHIYLNNLVDKLNNTELVRSHFMNLEGEKKNELGLVSRIEHDNYDYSKWHGRLIEVLPELKDRN
ncbi:MAG: hypothetical protein COW85_02845 [Ignavibacteria bacterium CG22_combo_CG10-13_8_21_14_all_37_15]|nr:MAG: hypothetical protein COW85_02845 [Ignavibacteria bacterium CG22_combo_CG10-13_8_21_14_all_37_15]